MSAYFMILFRKEIEKRLSNKQDQKKYLLNPLDA
jgi:hypothetical protein